MTPKARNVLRADESVPADEYARELPPPVKGPQTHTLAACLAEMEMEGQGMAGSLL